MRSLCVWLRLCVVVGLPCASAGEVRKIDARALYENAVSRHLRLSQDGSAIVLEWGELFEDDGPAAGYSYKPNQEVLSQDVRVKKELLIANPQARRALLIAGSHSPIELAVNGKAQKLGGGQRVGKYGRAWTFDPAALRPGKNAFVIGAQGTRATMWIARDEEYAAGSRARSSHPNRSAKSIDGGKTWDYDHLGPEGTVDGEYYVRVFLEHYREGGVLTLGVLDLADLHGKGIAPPISDLGAVRVAVDVGGGKANKVTLRGRFGTTFVPDGKTWSPCITS